MTSNVHVPVIKGRKMNKILCLTFLGLAAALLIGALAVYVLTGDGGFAAAICAPSAITGAFGLFYGVLWLIYSKKEAKKQKHYERAAEILAEEPDNSVEWHDFTLNREELLREAKNRFEKIVIAIAIICAVVFVIISAVMIITAGFEGMGQLSGILVFSFIIAVPGIVIQYVIYRQYADSVPERIRLFPGRLYIDDKRFDARNTEHIKVSSARSRNSSSPEVFRCLTVRSEGKSIMYRLDFRVRGEDNPQWAQYAEFVYELEKWAKSNAVPCTVDYMD